MLTDIEISKKANLLHISDIAKKIGIDEEDLEFYGKYKAKIANSILTKIEKNKDGKLILVTAINPTPTGEGKTTITIGLGDALNKLNRKCVIALREPSLGPVMGFKGGATGGGYSQVAPMEDINLHFTGDMHALTTANNLLSAIIDNHIFQGNELKIDINNIIWKRALDLNDRVLRNIVVGLGGSKNGITREDEFVITVASEMMAVLCLAKDLNDLKARVANITIGYTIDKEVVKVSNLKIEDAIVALLKDAIKPNIVQTLENNLCIMHGGPFANIAHGCNSIIATKLALKLGDYVITEAGFGADLGGEKFLDIKCREGELNPSAVVVVATVKALKYNANINIKDLEIPNVEALKIGFVNLEKHIENMKLYKVPVIVAVNKFATDSDEEIECLKALCNQKGVKCSISEMFEKGSEGGINLAKDLIELLDKEKSEYEPLYELNLAIKEKIEIIAKKIYGANEVKYTKSALNQIKLIEDLKIDKMPICIAKTQYSLSDNPKKLGRPKDFEITVSDVKACTGAGFIVVKTGEILTMPGLPKVPTAQKIKVLEDSTLLGIF